MLCINWRDRSLLICSAVYSMVNTNMKKTYAKPFLNSYCLSTDKALLVGSVYVPTTNYSPDKKYHCPYAPSHYCELHSDDMNKWRRSIEYAAQHKTPMDFYEPNGCNYKNNCDVYSLYIFKKQHENNGK